jgi:ubiquinone/menaquinone biosynthesis C-methylase UbiE
MFEVAADSYDRFMGRYSSRLAPAFADFAGVQGTVLDVGCGPGALTGELVARAERVTAVDPSEPFVMAARERFPTVDVHLASAESLPFDDDAFDTVLAQLVVHFMTDPVGGIREMARVSRGGVAACAWDMAQSPLTPFWQAAREAASGPVAGESQRPGTREGHLEELFAQAGLREIEATALEVRVEHETFDEWWDPFLLGVGPAGAYVAEFDDEGRERLRAHAVALLGAGPVSIPSRAWSARGLA